MEKLCPVELGWGEGDKGHSQTLASWVTLLSFEVKTEWHQWCHSRTMPELNINEQLNRPKISELTKQHLKLSQTLRPQVSSEVGGQLHVNAMAIGHFTEKYSSSRRAKCASWPKWLKYPEMWPKIPYTCGSCRAFSSLYLQNGGSIVPNFFWTNSAKNICGEW